MLDEEVSSTLNSRTGLFRENMFQNDRSPRIDVLFVIENAESTYSVCVVTLVAFASTANVLK